MNLRAAARGEPCMVRLPGCDGGGETTVLAHYRSVSLGAGVGKKPPDWLGAYACASCHNIVDSRVFLPDYSREKVRLAHAEGVLRTLMLLTRQGKIEL